MAQIFIDASTNPKTMESAAGIIIKDEQQTFEYGVYLGSMDNHKAEWEALIHSMKLSKQMNLSSLIIKTDAKLVADAINKDYVKQAGFNHYLKQYRALSIDFSLIIIDWIPRDRNKHADLIARRALQKRFNINC